MLAIAKAQIADLKELVRLNGVVQDIHAQLSPDNFRSDWTAYELEEFWLRRLQEADSTVLIANLATDVVGCIWFEVQDRPRNALHRSRRRVYVHHIVVDEKARGMGVGSILLNYAERLAERLGISNVVLDAWATNYSAQGFFNARGYDPINVVFNKVVAIR